MKILSRRNAPAPSGDVNGDGRVDGDDRTVTRSATETDGARAWDADRRTADGATAATATTSRHPAVDDPDPTLERTVDLDRDGTAERRVPVDHDRPHVDERTEPAAPVAVGPKPRASLLATLGLIASVAGALFVLTGTLAGYGIGLGAVGAVLAVLGLMATRRRHVAGKTDALIGILLGLGAVVLGIVALTGQFDWPTTDADWVGRFREWLDSQFADLL